MIAIIAFIGFMIALMTIGFIINLYLYLHRALPITPDDTGPESAAEPQRNLDDLLFR